MIGLDIFTGEKVEFNCPSTHKIDTPVTSKCEYQVREVNDLSKGTEQIFNEERLEGDRLGQRIVLGVDGQQRQLEAEHSVR